MIEEKIGLNKQGSTSSTSQMSCPKSFKPWIVTLVILAFITLGWVILENYREGGIVWKLLEHDDIRNTLKSKPLGNTSKYKPIDLPTASSVQVSYHTIIEAVRPGLISIDVALTGVAQQPDILDGPVMNYSRVGSGVIISDNGYVLTSWHVIEGAASVKATVYSAGGAKEYPLKLVNVDRTNDLALMRILGDGPFAHVIFGDSDTVRTGDVVLAMGSPFGFDQTITTGIISSRNRTVSVGGRVFEGLFQTDTPINRGNSGGPLVNVRGEVIGINTAIYSPTGVFSGIGFAIPINQAMPLVGGVIDFQGTAPAVAGGQLAAFGRQGRQTGNSYKLPNGKMIIAPHPFRGKCIDCHPQLYQTPGQGGGRGLGLGQGMIPAAAIQPDGYLGANLLNIDKLIAKQFKLNHPGGVLVDSVVTGSPAEVAGLQRGDIIYRVDGRKIATVADVQKIVGVKKAGDKVELIVFRNDRRQTLKVALGQAILGNTPQQAPTAKQPAEFEWFGAEITPINPALQSYVSGGVLVAEAAGIMGAAGVMKGDIIRAMNNKPVPDMLTFIKLTKKANLKDGILLDVIRAGKPMYITVKG
ncbi:MAG TPA: PDZ domain-containing protein [Nitrospirae bacterium]|nr:PDZ domain-containing protein [Nitrospirota bacterium]